MNVVIGYIRVIDSDAAEPPNWPISKLNPPRPTYLADLQNVAPDATWSFDFAKDEISGCVLNGELFEHGKALGEQSGLGPKVVTVGTVEEWTVSGTANHPFHMHVNPYQLQNVVDSTGWFKSGDWHDVLYEFDGDFSYESIKFSADTFTGDAVLHCHFLEHEDLGCMGFVKLEGTEGDTTGLCPTEDNPWSDVQTTCTPVPVASGGAGGPGEGTGGGPGGGPGGGGRK